MHRDRDKLFRSQAILVLDSAAQVVIQTRVDDCLLVLVECFTEGVVLASTLLFVHMKLVLDRAEALEIVLEVALVFDISSGKVIATSFADVDLAVGGRLGATNVA